MFTWPSAPLLSQYLLHKQHNIRNKHVLEISAGTALPGIVAAKLGARVTLSDYAEKCRENCMKSVIANGVDITYIPLTWGKVTPELATLPHVDVIIASDCFYDPKDFSDIMFTLSYLFTK